MLQILQRKFPYFGRKLSEIEFALSELRVKYSDLQVSSELELGGLKNRNHELEKENEFVLIQLFQTQSELDRPSPDFLELKSQFEELKREKNKAEIASLEKENEIKILKRQLDDSAFRCSNLVNDEKLLQKEIEVLKSSLEELEYEKNKAEVTSLENENEIKMLKRQIDDSASKFADLINDNQLSQKEIEVLRSRIVELSEIEDNHRMLLRNYEILEKDFQLTLKSLQDVTSLQAATRESELSVIEIENDRLLKNLHKTQEDLERLYLESEQNKSAANAFGGRWARLQQRLPTYVDFSIVRVGVKEISGQDQVVWSVSDYFKSGEPIDSLSFATVMVEGISGIAILGSDFGTVFYPSLVLKSSIQRDLFLGFNYSQIQKIESAINVIDNVLETQWSTATLDENFDQQFWKNSISMLVTDFKKLPNLLRINLVKLKLEVKNIDYENLWLELHDVAYGNFYAKKIELRLGASMVQPDGFSKYPKIEIPLVDGIEKPFSSWYAESSDIYGQKLEFRFDLDRQIMDMQTWSKLSPKDIGLCAALVNSLPRVLSGLRDDKILIDRDWSTWIEFAMGAGKILNRSRAPAPGAAEEEKDGAEVLEVDSKMPAITLDKVQANSASKKLISDTAAGKKVKKITVASKKK